MTSTLNILHVYMAEEGERVGDFRLSSPRVCKLALSRFAKQGGANPALVDAAYGLAEEAQFERRSYGRGVFYSWAYWNDGPAAKVDLGDPWPAARWPKATLAFELLSKHLDGEVNLLEKAS